MLANTPTISLLTQALDISALRQSVHAANVANAGVEGYRRMEVTFDRALAEATLQLTSAADGAGMSPLSQPVPTAQVTATNEAVRLDEEVAAMAQNALRYQTLLGAVERSFGALRMAIHEGRE